MTLMRSPSGLLALLGATGRFLPLLLACALLPLAARGNGSPPERFLETAVDEVLQVAYAPEASGSLAERIRPTLERFFAFDGLTRRAVGPGWRAFSAEQQARTKDLFTTLIIRTYSEKFDPSVRPDIRYGAVTDLERGRREIPSTVNYAGSSYNVAYRLEPDGASWRVYDVIIEGVSMVANYRAQFEALQNRGGPQAVIQSIESNLAAAKSE